ncbi:MAG: efflux transporter periplasmic adaptor subunit [Acidobacteria bacterium]|nr:efflux transporter periplasmic adaptor subunit [Acidobacteriota bacterium]|tara:strand:+ start:5991 stop:7382 length:1392 start_codon:yes stop_codon:yes gene_type:complete
MQAFKKLLAATFKLVIFIGVIGGGYYAYQRYTTEFEEEELGELPTVIAAVRDITVSVSATGILQPVKIIEIKSKASGEILEMPVEMGDFLEAGALIAQIDTRILDQELKQVEADYESAEIRLQIAQRQFVRAESLYAEDLISQNDLETSKQNFTSAESQFIRAEASLELARERLEDTTVTAPISGTIIAKTVEQGQIIASSTNNVSGGTVLIQMADLSELEIRTLVDEIDIGNVKAGLGIESTVEAFANLSFEGEVMKIEPQAVVQQSVTTFPVLSRIDNTGGLLLPGMNADVSIIIKERSNVLTVSNEAVRSPEDAREVIQLLGLDAPVAVLQSSLVTSVENSTQLASASMRELGDFANGNSENGHADSRETVTKAQPVGNISGDNDSRQEPAVVFVLDIDGRFHAREIVTGVRDWETSEVLAGLEEGEELVLLPNTSLLRSQQDIRDRFARQNTVVSLPGQ